MRDATDARPTDAARMTLLPPSRGTPSLRRGEGVIRTGPTAGRTRSLGSEEVTAASIVDCNPAPAMLKGFLVIGLTFGGLGGWAATAPLDSAAVAPGVIVVDTGRQKIQHPTGGVIREMLVRDGDRVEAGQTLIHLDPTQAEASRDIVESGFIAAAAEEERLLAELREEAEVAFDPALVAEAAARPGLAKVLDVQREVLASRLALRTRQTEVLQAQIEQSRNEINALEAEQASKDRQMALLADELSGSRQLLEEGLIAKTLVLELERSVESLKGEVLSIQATIAKAKSRINEIETQIMVQRSEFQDKVNAELKEAQLRKLQSQEELVGADDVLQRIDIRAPVSGLVVNNNIATQGGVVAPGEVIMEIVPDQDVLVIDSRVAITDIDSVAIGQKANVMLTAFNQSRTPALEGEVLHIAADRQVDEATNEPFFQAKIAVPEKEIARLDDGQELKPGMPADALIVTGERTVLDYLMKPIVQSVMKSWRED